MMTSSLRWMMAAVLLVGTACASGGSGGSTTLSYDVGLATDIDVQEVPLRVFERELYRMERRVGPPSIMLQTFWRDRPVFDDEREAGFVEARTRFILEARPRVRSAEGGPELYTARVRAENMGRLATGGDWMRMPPTPEFREYAGGIAAAIKEDLENRTRIR
jgi:hypothetical protein